MPWRLAALAPLVVAVAAIVWFLPFLTRDREQIVATPQPPPLFIATPIQLLLGGTACAYPVHIDATTDVARLRAARYSDAEAAHLTVTVAGPGYRATARFRDYADGSALNVPLLDPPRPLNAKLCVENGGPTAGLIGGSAEARTRGRTIGTVDGAESEAVPIVTLLRKQPASLAGRFGDVAAHAAAVGPGWVPAPLFGVLALLVALGLPAGLAAALRHAPDDQA
jgi:hypothetical protein